MSGTLLLALALAAGVALLGFLLRRGSGIEEAGGGRGFGPGAGSEPAASLAPEEEDDVDPEDATELIVEMSGSVWVSGAEGVRRVSLGGDETDPALAAAGYVNREEFESRLAAARARGDSAAIAGERLRPGDFTAARVSRGAPETEPWRVEALGPEGEYISFGFGAEAAARAALAALERHRVVRRPLDEDGNPIPASSEDFEEARLRAEQTFEELASFEDDPGDPPR